MDCISLSMQSRSQCPSAREPYDRGGAARRYRPPHTLSKTPPSQLVHPPELDQLFRDLDGRTVPGPEGVCQITVYSIMDEYGYRWLQLSLVGSTSLAYTLRVRPTDDCEAILRKVVARLNSL